MSNQNISLEDNPEYESICIDITNQYLENKTIPQELANKLKDIIKQHDSILKDPKYKNNLILTNKIKETKFNQTINTILCKQITNIIFNRYSNQTTRNRLINNITYRAWLIMRKYASIYLAYALYCLESNEPNFINELVADTRLDINRKINILVYVLIIGFVLIVIIAAIITYLRWKYIKPLSPTVNLKINEKIIKPVQ